MNIYYYLQTIAEFPLSSFLQPISLQQEDFAVGKLKLSVAVGLIG